MEDEHSKLLQFDSSICYRTLEEGKNLKSMTEFEGSGSEIKVEHRQGNNGGQDGQGINGGHG